MPFRNWTHQNDLELSKFIWSLKDQNKEFDIPRFILLDQTCESLPLEKASN